MKNAAWILSLILILGGCTQGREASGPLYKRSSYMPSMAEPVAEVQFAGQTTQTLQMTATGGALYLTGKPFGFSKWDISSNAESPYLTFAMSDDIEAFPPMGKWVVDWYASGAIGISGGLAILSGSAGSSVVNMSDLQFPKEIFRYPPLQSGSDVVPRNEQFVYKGIATNPTQPYLYGFRQQDLAYTIRINQNGSLTPVAQTSYGQPGQSVCCAMSATFYNSKVFVAMRTRLWVFDIESTGWLGARKELTDLQPINVQSTARFLYVQHEATTSIPGSTSHPSGIYIYDTKGNSVNFLPITPLAFAVAPDDRYVYANMDDERIVIYKIGWTNSY